MSVLIRKCKSARCHLINDSGVRLSARAVRLCSANRTFARRLRAKGNAGRECLQSFMRHWLAARLARQHPVLFRLLPLVFSLGAFPSL